MAARFHDDASYATDTSSITNPVELQSHWGDDVDDATSALTGLTGWTSAYGAAATAITDVSELGASEAGRTAAFAAQYAGEDISFGVDGGEIEVTQGPRSGRHRSPLTTIPQGRAVAFPSPGGRSRTMYSDEGSVVSGASYNSHGSKQRDPVPAMKGGLDDTESLMWEEDCNYDINPTLLFLVLESRDWKECVSLLDGRGLQNKDDAWNLGVLFGVKKKDEVDGKLAEKRKTELKQQTRTWIVRREKNGQLRWRMLPIHAALAFGAPFEVVLRLYHLYPGSVRCRNDQGMLPLHHVFSYGSEDKILELFLDVFPEALTVVDDKGRLPVACTPKDGSDNERRSHIMTLFSNFQVETAVKEMETEMATEEDEVEEARKGVTFADPAGSSHSEGSDDGGTDPPSEGTLGATPRYTSDADYTPVTYGAIKHPPAAKLVPTKKKATKKAEPKRQTSAETDAADRYALLDDENGENVPFNGQSGLGMLSPIPEEDDTLAKRALKSELLALGEKHKPKGLKKLLRGRKRYA